MFDNTEIYEEDEAAAAALFAVVATSIFEAREARNEKRRPHSLYLRRRELLPNPRAGTPWQRLWASQEDWAFITTMGFDVATFKLLLEGPGRFGERWENTPIPRNDVSVVGAPRLTSCSLDGAGALGLVLHYLGSAMLEVTLQQIFALTPSVPSRYLEFAENILYEVLLQTQEARISMPGNEEEFEQAPLGDKNMLYSEGDMDGDHGVSAIQTRCTLHDFPPNDPLEIWETGTNA